MNCSYTIISWHAVWRIDRLRHLWNVAKLWLCLGIRHSDSVAQMLLDQSVMWSRKVIHVWLGN